jgi:hypothetical protein
MKIIKSEWMKIFLLLGTVLLITIFIFSSHGQKAVAGTIVGSDHDFSASGWSGGQICILCHTPHHADTTVTGAPLWNHQVTATTDTKYSSPTLNATVGQPDGASKLCLSCHDGTVAVDSFGGATGTTIVTGDALIGTSLSDDHPISFTYNAALATTDGGLFDPSSKTVTIGSGSFTKTGTINDVILYSGKVQCSSCHDVHNNYVAGGGGGDPLLKISKASSAICLACHNK